MKVLRSLPYEILNYICFLFVVTFLISLQTSLWLQLFGFFPAPYLWVPTLCYWAITRDWVRGSIMAYLLSLVLFTFTGLALDIIFTSVITLYVILYMLRNRVLWRGHTYFSLACFVATLAHPLLVFIFSNFLETQPVRQFLFFDWILSPLLTALAALPLYNILIAIDRISFGKTSENVEAEFL